MGIFDKTPKPSLAVTLTSPNNPDNVYFPGDVIEGRVTLHDAAPGAHLNDLVVRLVGHTKTRVVVSTGQSVMVYRGRAALLHVPVNVAATSHTADSWPFRMFIPTSCSLQNGLPPVNDTKLPIDPAKYYSTFKVKEPFDVRSNQPLPPSLSLVINSHSSKAFVTYEVQAELHVLGGAFVNTSFPLILSSPVPEKTPPPSELAQTLTFASPLLAADRPSDKADSLSLREKASVLFKSSKLPNISFNAIMSTPLVVQRGTGITIDLTLAPSLAESSAPCPSEVTVDEVDIRLRAERKWRSAGSKLNSIADHAATTAFHHRSGPLTAPLTESSGWTAHFTSMPVPADMPPTLNTHNIFIAYSLETKWTLRCAGVTRKVDMAAYNINVCGGGAGFGMESVAGPSGSRRSEEDDDEYRSRPEDVECSKGPRLDEEGGEQPPPAY